MTTFFIFIVLGLILLVWSADKFVDGASNVARHYGMSPLLIGMIVIGFGTSLPEMLVSIIASVQDSPGIALGNAYGSNITNIALILGITSLMMPIAVNSQVLKKELPILFAVTIITVGLIYDLSVSRADAFILLFIFALLMTWTIKEGLKNKRDALNKEMDQMLLDNSTPIKKSLVLLFGGLMVLIISSRMLVYGAVGIAGILGVSDIIVGLTVVAVGTSLPEFASSIIAARKGEPDIALGNVLGSNLFNTLVVVGISGIIAPIKVDKEILFRDVGVMTFLTLSLFIFGYGYKRKGRISRMEGGLLFSSYIVYTVYLITTIGKV